MQRHEVIIVGAGPSGASCAKALRKAGADVLILEKEKLPRNKICSGILFGQAQVLLEKYFGALPPQEVYCTPQELPASHILEWRSDRGFFPYVFEIGKDGQAFPDIYLNIWRSGFDNWLAGQSGAPVLVRRRMLALSQNGDVRLTVLPRGGVPQEYACRYLVGADGGNSTVRGCIDGQWRDKPADVVVYQEYCRFGGTGALRPGHWHVFFEPAVGDILCCAHRKDDLLVLCMGAGPGRDIRGGMRVFKKFLADAFQVALGPVERAEGCTIRQLPPHLGTGRVLLTGEAAGFAYLNGEGISAALDSGYRAGEAIARALRGEGDALALYRSGAADMLRHMQRCLSHMHFMVGQ